MNGGDEAFPSALDQWTPEDWQEYRRRIEDSEGSVRAMVPPVSDVPDVVCYCTACRAVAAVK
ncbi:hypothetical protein [Streptomyces olivaceoviridis]|uniref:hypothetical protein n=1 Tax=Streptomyces olivaceoviridis TaxID=1921 RepID=UPI00368A1F5A